MADKMQTGEELNAAVAERVMGWRSVWVRRNSTGRVLDGYYYSAETCADDCEATDFRPLNVWATADWRTIGEVEDWKPSTDIAAAWTVAEQLAKPGLSFMADFQVQRDGRRRYFAQFLADGLSDGLHNEWTEAESMPLAICRAALKAVEHAKSTV